MDWLSLGNDKCRFLKKVDPFTSEIQRISTWILQHIWKICDIEIYFQIDRSIIFTTSMHYFDDLRLSKNFNPSSKFEVMVDVL